MGKNTDDWPVPFRGTDPDSVDASSAAKAPQKMHHRD